MVSRSSPSPLLDTITGMEALLQAWGRVLGNHGAAGGDGQTVEAFAATVPDALIRIGRDVLGGTYAPGPLRRISIPKASGGTRPLAIPCVADRVLQTAAAAVLSRILEPEFEDSSFGYRPGRSVGMAVARISALRRQGYVWVVDGDIERFFENVTHDRLLKKLARYVDDPGFVDLVGLWLAAAEPDGRGLAQGSPISPVLSNLHLDDVDERIEGKGVRLVRFADDFVLLTRDEAAAEGARARMARLLSEHGLRLHPDKTRVVPFEQGFRFLGKLFVRSLVVDAEDEDPPPPQAPPAPPPELETETANTETGGHAPLVRPLYVLEPGRRLGLRNRSLSVVDVESGAELLAVQPGRVGRIELGPDADAEPEALRQALDQGTPVAFVDGRGRTRGRLQRDAQDRWARHLNQARHVLDPDLRLALAQTLVGGRIQTQQGLLRRLNRRRKVAEVATAAEKIGRIRRKLRVGSSIDHAMGVEGEAAALYWPALGRCLEHGWRFRRRVRRTGADPVNLVLDWLASLLRREVEALTGRWDLHLGFAILHATRDGHDALVSDLMEEFRAPLTEGFAVYVFNNRILKPEHFIAAPGGAGKSILPEGRRALIRAWEASLARPVKSPGSGLRRTWRGVIDDQIGLFAAHIDCGEAYRPYHLDH